MMSKAEELEREREREREKERWKEGGREFCRSCVADFGNGGR
jgi:hypothetical protein